MARHEHRPHRFTDSMRLWPGAFDSLRQKRAAAPETQDGGSGT